MDRARARGRSMPDEAEDAEFQMDRAQPRECSMIGKVEYGGVPSGPRPSPRALDDRGRQVPLRSKFALAALEGDRRLGFAALAAKWEQFEPILRANDGVRRFEVVGVRLANMDERTETLALRQLGRVMSS